MGFFTPQVAPDTGAFSPKRKSKMAKIKLGSTPKSFKRIVTVDMLDGTKGSIECQFKYRTRTQFGQFLDTVFSSAGVKPDVGEDDIGVLGQVMAVAILPPATPPY